MCVCVCVYIYIYIYIYTYTHLHTYKTYLRTYIMACVSDRSVGKATDYGLEVPRSNHDGNEIFPVQTGPEAHPASCKWLHFISGSKVQPGRETELSTSSSNAVMEE